MGSLCDSLILPISFVVEGVSATSPAEYRSSASGSDMRTAARESGLKVAEEV